MAMNGCSIIPVNTRGGSAWRFSVFTSTKNFRRIFSIPLNLLFLRSTVSFLSSHHFSNFLNSYSVALLVLSALELFAQFHPVARCLNPSFDLKKLKIWDFFHFKIKSPNVKRSLQSYKVSHKYSPQFWH